MVLKPIDDEVRQAVKLTPRLDQLKGRVVGLVDTFNTTSPEFLERTGELFVAEYGVSSFVHVRNPIHNAVAPQPIFDDIFKRCHFVVCGVGI